MPVEMILLFLFIIFKILLFVLGGIILWGAKKSKNDIANTIKISKFSTVILIYL